ncbi:hypothetical protein ACJVDH_08270 [Pedobacter sp. AW1-32]|uniref:hypothetical protein n=1 Tax=Pedobacter sp. AW1-32 TaxID=3383026 RepID=UPI003FF14F06
MQKKLFLFILLFLPRIIHAQNTVELKVNYSELYATYDFVEKISDNYPDNAFKAEFSKSRYNTNQFKALVKQFDNLKIDYLYHFEQYAPTLKSGLASRSLIEKNLIDSKTIKAFKSKSFGVLPNDELAKLSNIMESFIPVYNELIYNPNKEIFEEQLIKINQEISNDKVSKVYSRVMKFYGAEWDNDIPFNVVAYPTIGKTGIGARAFLNIAVVRFPLNFKSYDVLFSVMLHEIFHIGYDSQPIGLKNNLKNWFESTKSKNSQYAFLLLNEVLATGLGNGYAYLQLKGQPDPDDWYYVKYVNLMAKEIYPLLSEYLSRGKTIDENFISSYVKIYDSKFSDWSNELDNILTYRAILTDQIEDARYFKRNYPYTFHKLIPNMSLNGLEEIKKQPLTKIIIIADDHKKKLNMIKDSFKELKDIKMDPKKEFIQVFDLMDNTKLFIINRYASSVESMMETSFKSHKID